MPKLKTHRGAAKRFKITGNGKIMRRCGGRGHLMRKKDSARKRRLSKMKEVAGGQLKAAKRMVPHML